MKNNRFYCRGYNNLKVSQGISFREIKIAMKTKPGQTNGSQQY